MKRFLVLFVLAFLVAFVAAGQNTLKADQGKPGNQGPWPVSITGSVIIVVDGGNAQGPGLDGGLWKVQEFPGNCLTRADSNVDGGIVSLPIPATPLANRYYVVVCNSNQNVGSPYVKCRGDGTAPVMAIGNAGAVLGVGDCVPYNQTAVVNCIADTAQTAITSSECGP